MEECAARPGAARLSEEAVAVGVFGCALCACVSKSAGMMWGRRVRTIVELDVVLCDGVV